MGLSDETHLRINWKTYLRAQISFTVASNDDLPCNMQAPGPAMDRVPEIAIIYEVRASRSVHGILRYHSSSDTQEGLFSYRPSSEVLFWNDDPWC